MLTREKAIELLQQRREFLCTEYGVTKIGIFGSFASGSSGDASDVDVVVEFDHPIGLRFVELAEYLEELLGRKVDILTPTGIEAIRAYDVAQRIKESIVYV